MDGIGLDAVAVAGTTALDQHLGGGESLTIWGLCAARLHQEIEFGERYEWGQAFLRPFRPPAICVKGILL